MDDFAVYGDSFDHCLRNLKRVLQRCEETNLALSWEKCRFMVREEIVLGHKISGKGIEVDKAKLETIAGLHFLVLSKGCGVSWAMRDSTAYLSRTSPR